MKSAAKYLYISLVSALIFTLSPLASAQEMLNLTGTWTGSHRNIVFRIGAIQMGEVETTLTIDKQDGALFQGLKTWKRIDKVTVKSDIGNVQGVGGTEIVIGLIDFDGEQITIAEGEDTGIYRGRIIDKDHLMLTYVESDIGDAALFKVILTRQP